MVNESVVILCGQSSMRRGDKSSVLLYVLNTSIFFGIDFDDLERPDPKSTKAAISNFTTAGTVSWSLLLHKNFC